MNNSKDNSIIRLEFVVSGYDKIEALFYLVNPDKEKLNKLIKIFSERYELYNQLYNKYNGADIPYDTLSEEEKLVVDMFNGDWIIAVSAYINAHFKTVDIDSKKVFIN